MVAPGKGLGLWLSLGALVAGCAGSSHDESASGDNALSAAPSAAARIKDFECTSVASSTSNDHLKLTRLDLTADETAAGVPTGMVLTGFEPTLTSSTAIGFGVSHVRDTTVSGHGLSVYKIDFGADSILPGASGGTLTIPTAYSHLALESSAALNVATLQLTPSNVTATYKCKKDTRKSNPGPTPDPLSFEGAAKTAVANDPCAKTVASAVMNQLIEGIEDRGVDVPDTFVFTSIDRTDTGFKTVVNGATVPVVVGAGCSIKSMDTSAAVGQIGE